MNQTIENCPQCGADIAQTSTHCTYCDVSSQAEDIDPAAKSPGLPPEYSHLKRPKPRNGASLLGAVVYLIGGTFFIIFLIFLSNIFAVTVIDDYRAYNNLSRDGLTTQGTITKMVQREDDEGGVYYSVGYQFTLPINGDPTNFENYERVPRDFYASHEKGQTIDILYLPSDPTLSAIKSDFEPPNRILTFILIGAGILLFSVALGTLYKGWRQLYGWRRLRNDGQQTHAVVFDRWEGKDSDGDPTYFVAIAFKIASPQGGPQTITYAERNVSIYKKYGIGDRVVIRYLPDKPKICQFEEDNQFFRDLGLG